MSLSLKFSVIIIYFLNLNEILILILKFIKTLEINVSIKWVIVYPQKISILSNIERIN
jgi:hypothetical protein